MRSVLFILLAGVVTMAPIAAMRRADAIVVTAARAIQPGELVVLTVTTIKPVDEVRVQAFGRTLRAQRTAPTEWRALVGIDLETKPGRYDVSITAGPSPAGRLTHLLTVLPKRFTTRTLRVDPSFVSPSPEALVRIKDDAERLSRVWMSSSEAPLWSGPFVPPVPNPANSAFGTRSVFNGQPRNPHSGADFLSPAGTPVKAPNAGRIALAGDLYFTGNTVVIDHGAGLFSLFAHLRTIAVHESDMVSTGTVVGEVGSTGRVTGPHLHWTVRANDARVDPLSLLAVLGAKSK